MAGGSGERFWPLSHASRPKQLLRLTHPEQTLLEEALSRVEPLVGRDGLYVATNTLLQDVVCSHCGLTSDRVFAEPDRRNTLGCLAWVAASLLAARPGEDPTLIILTADHRIGEPELFRETLVRAAEAAEETGALVTLGIQPTRPDTGFGYLQAGDEAGGQGARRVLAFHEKPNHAKAEEYLASGAYYWNSGMFVWKLGAFLSQLRKANPSAAAAVEAMRDALTSGDHDAALAAFRTLDNQSIDYALMERADNVLTIPSSFPWDDVGSWDALERSFPADEAGNVLRGKVVAIDAKNCIVENELGRPVGVLGLEDVIVVASSQGILICHKDRAQEVREIARLAAKLGE